MPPAGWCVGKAATTVVESIAGTLCAHPAMGRVDNSKTAKALKDRGACIGYP